MPKILSKEQIEQYHETGFVSPIEAVSANYADIMYHGAAQKRAY